MEPKVNIALEAARAGCKELLSFAYRLDQLEIKEKGPSNFVTQLDRKVETIIIDSLKAIYPPVPCLSLPAFFFVASMCAGVACGWGRRDSAGTLWCKWRYMSKGCE